MSDHVKGIWGSISSAILFGIVPLLFTLCIEGGSNVLTASTARCCMALPLMWVGLLITEPKGSRLMSRAELRKMIPATLLLIATMLLLFIAYGMVGTGVATTLHFSYPVFTMLGSLIFLQQRFHKIDILCLLMVMAGVVLCYDPRHLDSLPGAAISVFSGLTYAGYMIYVKKSGIAQIDAFKFSFYIHCLMSLFFLIVTPLSGQLILDLPARIWLINFALSIMQGILAFVLLQVGLRYISPSHVSILSTFEPLTAILIGIVVLGEPAGLKNISGMVLILAAVLLVTLSGGLKEKQQPVVIIGGGNIDE